MKFSFADTSWWSCVYAQDVHSYLLEREKKCAKFEERSPQLQFRKLLVDYIIRACDKMGFCTTVCHLAVYYLDFFMDQHSIEEEHLQLISLGCLIVAVKVDEKDALIPKMSDFNALLANRYTPKEFFEIEVAVMEFMNWDLLVPTTATFVEYYMQFCVCPEDMCAGAPLSYSNEALVCIQEYISHYLNITILDHKFRQFSPSIIAASCIVATRAALSFTPIWPGQLREITHYELSHLKICAELLIWSHEYEKILTESTVIESADSPQYSSDSSFVNDSDSSGNEFCPSNSPASNVLA